jgi:hypothetical protein
MTDIQQQDYDEAVRTVNELQNQVPENSPLLSWQFWCTFMNDGILNLEDRQWCQSMSQALIDIYGINFEEKEKDEDEDADEDDVWPYPECSYEGESFDDAYERLVMSRLFKDGFCQ